MELKSISFEQGRRSQFPGPYPEYFIFMPVKNMRHEVAMRPEPLPGHRTAQAFLLFRHISHMVSICIHNDILICLFEPTVHGDRLSAQSVGCSIGVPSHHHIHQFQLPLNDQARVRQYPYSRMILLKYGIGIFWYMDGREEGVLRRVVIRGGVTRFAV